MLGMLKRYYYMGKPFKFFIYHPFVYYNVFKDGINKFFKLDDYTKPRNIVLKLHSSCNAKCSFCYAVNDSFEENENALKLDDWKKVIDDAKELGCYTVTLSGGEPMIYPHIVELVEYIYSKNMVPFSVTNGIFKDITLLDRLSEAGLCALNFSLIGPQKEHDSIVRVNGSHDQILEKIEYCTKNTKITPLINHVFSKESAKNRWYEYVWDTAKKAGAKVFNVLPECINSKDKDSLLDEDELKVYDNLLEKNHVFADTKNYLKPECPAGKEDLFVNDLGEVQPCPFIPVSFGNIKKNSMKESFLKMQNHEMFNKHSAVCYAARDHEFIDKYIIPSFKNNEVPIKLEKLDREIN